MNWNERKTAFWAAAAAGVGGSMGGRVWHRNNHEKKSLLSPFASFFYSLCCCCSWIRNKAQKSSPLTLQVFLFAWSSSRRARAKAKHIWLQLSGRRVDTKKRTSWKATTKHFYLWIFNSALVWRWEWSVNGERSSRFVSIVNAKSFFFLLSVMLKGNAKRCEDRNALSGETAGRCSALCFLKAAESMRNARVQWGLREKFQSALMGWATGFVWSFDFPLKEQFSLQKGFHSRNQQLTRSPSCTATSRAALKALFASNEDRFILILALQRFQHKSLSRRFHHSKCTRNGIEAKCSSFSEWKKKFFSWNHSAQPFCYIEQSSFDYEAAMWASCIMKSCTQCASIRDGIKILWDHRCGIIQRQNPNATFMTSFRDFWIKFWLIFHRAFCSLSSPLLGVSGAEVKRRFSPLSKPFSISIGTVDEKVPRHKEKEFPA